MVRANRSGLLGDNRFLDARIPKKKKLPHQLHWFLGEEYFTDEILGVYQSEIDRFDRIARHVFTIYKEYTEKLLNAGNLDEFRMPSLMQDLVRYSWAHKDRHPFFLGRFDVNGVFENTAGKVIEFNADTCSTLPETIIWQKKQVEDASGKSFHQFNNLEKDIHSFFDQRKNMNGEHKHVIIGSSLGYEEDVINTNVILDVAFKAGVYSLYSDLEHVIFDEDQGIFLEYGNEHFQADFFYKLFPWDWVVLEEPDLLSILHKIITNEYCTVLNPAYTSLWQNKLFLAKLTEAYPSDMYLAKTYTSYQRELLGHQYVKKPVLGRLGENVQMIKNGAVVAESAGDYGSQQPLYQEYIPNAIDRENYTYQAGVFVTNQGASALNIRTAPTTIITDDCEFYSHQIIEEKGSILRPK